MFVVTSCRTDLTSFGPYGITSQQIFLAYGPHSRLIGAYYGTRYHTKNNSGGATLDNSEAQSAERIFQLVPKFSKWYHILPYLKHVPIK